MDHLNLGRSDDSIFVDVGELFDEFLQRGVLDMAVLLKLRKHPIVIHRVGWIGAMAASSSRRLVVSDTRPHVPPVTTSEPPVVSYRLLPALKRENLIREDDFNMEMAVWRAVALLELLARQDCTSTERQRESHAGGMACGMMRWADDLNRVLERDWRAANASRITGRDAITDIRKLVNTVEKVCAMLMMFAHDLSSTEYLMDAKLGMEPPDADIAPLLSLASDAIEYLKASFYDRFGRDLPMDEIDRELSEELLLKFPQACAKRRAA